MGRQALAGQTIITGVGTFLNDERTAHATPRIPRHPKGPTSGEAGEKLHVL